MKIKHFTHNDWDGVSCALVSQYAYAYEDDFSVEFIDNGSFFDRLLKFFDKLDKEYQDYDMLIISDLGLRETPDSVSLAEKINKINKICDLEVVWVDHHTSSKWLNRYNYCTCNNAKYQECGASLIFKDNRINDKIKKRCIPQNRSNTWVRVEKKRYEELASYIDYVREYDTFHFKITKEEKPLEMNYYFKLFGVDFYEKMIERIMNDKDLYNAEDEKLAKIYKSKKDQEVQLIVKNHKVVFLDVEGEKKKVGIVYNSNPDITSVLGNTICENDTTIDFCMIFYKGGVALRSLNDKFNCAEYAQKFGGGGHFNAAGFKDTQQVFDVESLLVNLLVKAWI